MYKLILNSNPDYFQYVTIETFNNLIISGIHITSSPLNYCPSCGSFNHSHCHKLFYLNDDHEKLMLNKLNIGEYELDLRDDLIPYYKNTFLSPISGFYYLTPKSWSKKHRQTLIHFDRIDHIKNDIEKLLGPNYDEPLPVFVYFLDYNSFQINNQHKIFHFTSEGYII